MNNLLPILLLLPIVGAIIGCFVPKAQAKVWALIVSLAALALGVVLALNFDFSRPAVQFDIGKGVALTMSGTRMSLAMGIDAISLWLIILTVGLMPPAILASFQSIQDRAKEYYAWMLVLLSTMLGVFMARDALVFYVFFELTLIPMFFIIGIWGGPERRYAAIKFFLFTFTGGVFTLVSLIYLGSKAGSFDILTLVSYAQTSLSYDERFWVLLGLLAGFAVKVPLFPVHTWLPLAHTEAPTAGSVILAGVLLKLGTYGILRVALPAGLVTASGSAFPELHRVLGWICVIGIIYGALAAWVQQDIKKLVAYSSVSHLGFCVLGLLALNEIGMQGSVLYMINHGLSTGAMFLCIGMIYDRHHTRDIDKLSGLARIMPKMGFFFVFFVMCSIGLPGLNGFASEFLTVQGAFVSKALGMEFAVMAALGVIFGAVYMLHMTAKVMFGPLKIPHHEGHDEAHAHDEHAHHEPKIDDINGRELAVLVPIAIVCVVVGLMPGKLMNTMKQNVTDIRNPLTVTQTPSSQQVALVKN